MNLRITFNGSDDAVVFDAVLNPKAVFSAKFFDGPLSVSRFTCQLVEGIPNPPKDAE